VIRRNSKLLVLHLAANALMLWLAYEWLGVDESSTRRLLLSAIDAVAILALFCWLYGATLVWFHVPAPRLNESFRAALRHIGGLLALAVAGLVLYGLAAKGAAAIEVPALKIASWLTWTFRTPVKPATITAILQATFWLLRWVVLPVLLLPLAGAIAVKGRNGWSHLLARRPWKLWIVIPLLALAGLCLPLIVLNWKPKPSGFALEFASFTLRAMVAYALFLFAILGLARTAAASGTTNGSGGVAS